MTRDTRYLFFSLVFLLVAIGLFSRSYGLLGLALAVSVALGLWIEKIDNQRDERFKHHNRVHNYHH